MKCKEMKNKKKIKIFCTVYVHDTSTEEFTQFRCPSSRGCDIKNKEPREGGNHDQMCGKVLTSGTNGLGLFSLEKRSTRVDSTYAYKVMTKVSRKWLFTVFPHSK